MALRATKQQKLARAGGLLAVNMAKKGNDPLHKKLATAEALVKKLRAQINKKYGQKGMSAARKSVS